MSSGAELVQRRGQHATPGPAAPAQDSTAGSLGGLKTWHMWMLFGLGWPSILLFFLSTIPAFSPKVQGLLITFGWLCCLCWWMSTASGLMTDNMGRKQTVAWKANAIMAGIGSVIGGVFLVSYAYYNWPWLYIAAFAVAVGGVFAVRSLDDSKAAGTAAGAAAPQAAGAMANGGAAAGQQ